MNNLQNFVTYKSSAGSGKTYTLVREYLRIVIESDNPTRYRNILAITFTNKAANEMKERVLDNLKELSQELDSELLTQFAEEFGMNKSLIKAKSQQILQSVLHNYSDLKILTIDKFTHKIIRAFSNDLGLTTDFEIEMDSDSVLKEAIDLLVSKAGSDNYTSKLLVEYLNQHIDQEKTWNIEESIFNFSRELLKEDNEYFLNKLRKLDSTNLESAKNFVLTTYSELEKRAIDSAKKCIELILTNGIIDTDFNYKTIFKILKRISEGDFKDLKEEKQNINNAIETGVWLKKGASDSAHSAMESISGEISELYLQIEQAKKELFLFKLLKENIYNLILIKEIDTAIETIKEEGNILLISDFNKLISDSIKNQPAPFIYEKIGERYKNIMIDEFQDTSVMQWHNLLPLIDNSLAIGEKTLLVGDAKQAIYRFRGGKVEQFVQLPSIIDKSDDELLEEREIALTNNHKNEVLETNYRSHNQVIEFNNWFFDELTHFLKEEKQLIYEGQKQLTTGKNEGYVEVNFLDTSEDKEEIYLKSIKEKIELCKQDGFSLRDITILVNKNTSGTLISNYLINENYAVITSESLLIAEDNEVNFIFNFLKYIQNNKDNVAKLEVIKFFFENERYSPALLTYSRKVKNRATIHLEEVLMHISPDFKLESIYEMSIYDMTETISRTFLTKKANAFQIKFMDVVHSYSNSVNDLKSFIDYFEKKSEKLSLETPDSDAITIMTVHKSKGLQFPVVISAFTDWSFYPGSMRPNVWVELGDKFPEIPVGILNLKNDIKVTDYEQLAEIDFENAKLDKFNMLYVTLTRAEKRLFILCDRKIETSKTIKDDIINSYIYQVCSQHSDFSDDSLIIGERKKHIQKEREGENQLKIEEIISTNWREKIRISKQYQELWGDKSYKGKIAYGNLIHNILSMVESEKDIEATIAEYVNQGLIKTSEIELYETEIRDILKIEGVGDWFTSHVKTLNEKEIISKDGKLYRPDKIVVYPNKTVVIDFKTGEKQSSYSKQLTNYAELLEEMDYQNVEKYLIFTKERELVFIP